MGDADARTKIVALILVSLVIVLALILIFKPDLLSWIKEMPEYKYKAGDDIDMTKLKDYLKTQEDCVPVAQVGESQKGDVINKNARDLFILDYNNLNDKGRASIFWADVENLENLKIVLPQEGVLDKVIQFFGGDRNVIVANAVKGFIVVDKKYIDKLKAVSGLSTKEKDIANFLLADLMLLDKARVVVGQPILLCKSEIDLNNALKNAREQAISPVKVYSLDAGNLIVTIRGNTIIAKLNGEVKRFNPTTKPLGVHFMNVVAKGKPKEITGFIWNEKEKKVYARKDRTDLIHDKNFFDNKLEEVQKIYPNLDIDSLMRIRVIMSSSSFYGFVDNLIKISTIRTEVPDNEGVVNKLKPSNVVTIYNFNGDFYYNYGGKETYSSWLGKNQRALIAKISPDDAWESRWFGMLNQQIRNPKYSCKFPWRNKEETCILEKDGTEIKLCIETEQNKICSSTCFCFIKDYRGGDIFVFQIGDQLWKFDVSKKQTELLDSRSIGELSQNAIDELINKIVNKK